MPGDFDIRAVTLASALAWARGEIHDSKLDPARPEIVFWNELLNIHGYRAALLEIKRLNCPAMVLHVCAPNVWRKVEKEGAVCTFSEKIIWRGEEKIARRYVHPPKKFQAWLKKCRLV